MASTIQPLVNSVLSHSLQLIDSHLVRRHAHAHSHSHSHDDGDHDHEEAHAGECAIGNEYNGNMGARISSIFVILVAGTFGALFPLISLHWRKLNIHPMFFFVAKYFGSGVVVATALIHLLQHASEALTAECLGPAWQVYPYAYGICLAAVFFTFFIDLVSKRYLEKRGIAHTHGPGFSSNQTDQQAGHIHANPDYEHNNNNTFTDNKDDVSLTYKDIESDTESVQSRQLAMQLGSIFILEFGIIFHSIFIGLSLAVAGEEFVSLYIVLVFHQMFEGLGLGTRIAIAPWPGKKKLIPWILGLAYGLTTPIAIAIGLGVRASYPPGSYKSLVTNGVFDSISAGILLYVGLVELVGNEFFGDKNFKNATTFEVLLAFVVMAFGAGLMALLGKWA